MLIVSGRIYVRPGPREAFLTRSGEAVAQARRAWGCRDFVVAADPIEAHRVTVYEEWESEEALIAFRGDGPGDDLSSSIVKADVAKHMVASSEPVVPSDHGFVNLYTRSPLASCSRRSSDTAPLAVYRTATTSLGNNTTLQSIENAYGSLYADTIDGDDNVNLIDARGGDDTVNGNGGDDIIDGYYGNDTLHGNDGNDELYGDIGNDTLYGDAGNDLLSGEDGNDILYGGSGDDTLIGVEGDDELYGGDDNDSFYGFSGADVHDGGNGIDLLTFYYAGSGVTANMSTGVVTWGTETNTFSNIEKLWGGFYNDTLTGDNLGNEIGGSTGNDTLYGQGGNDTVTGGIGTDTVYGGSGSDLLYGGNGDDLLYGDADADYLIGNVGEDTLTGGSGGDFFGFFGSDYASGYEVDTVTDFNTTDGDVLEFTDVLSFDPLTDVITDFVQITDDGTDSFVAIDADGGADSFTQIAILESVTGLTDEQQLYGNGHISVF